MVTAFPYASIKALKLTNIHLPELVMIAAGIALLWYSARIGLLVVSFSYAASGVFNRVRLLRGETPSENET